MGIWRPRLSKWRIFPEREALLLFAQSLVELLFHHTADSFRARTLNLHSLVKECLYTVRSVIAGEVMEGALTPLVEELVHRLADPGAIGQFSVEVVNQYRQQLGDKKRHDPRELELSLSALVSEFEARYWDYICTEIKCEVRSCSTSQRIIDLADAFISEAELKGWDRQAIFGKAKWHFFHGRSSPRYINGLAALDEFLDFFGSSEPKEFVCVFRATRDIDDARQVLAKASVEVLESALSAVPSDARSRNFLGDNEQFPRFVFVKSCKALDSVSARKEAEDRLQFIVNMFRFQSHSYRPRWSGAALVYEAASLRRYLIEQPISPMMAGSDSRAALSRISAEDLADIFIKRRLSTLSHVKLFSILEYHRAAIDSPTPENQLLNLWAGIEGMMPAPFGDKAHVLHFIDLLVPPLTLTYVEQQIRYLVESYSGAGQGLIEQVRSVGIGSTDVERCASLLSCVELETERSNFIAALEVSPLLRLRTKAVVSKLASPARLKKALDRRRKWICWQVQRIYSARNKIIHNADSSVYLNALVENIHSYFDTAVCSVIDFAKGRGGVTSIGAALQALRIHELAYLKGLSSDEPFETSSFMSVMFGAGSPLSPR